MGGASHDPAPAAALAPVAVALALTLAGPSAAAPVGDRANAASTEHGCPILPPDNALNQEIADAPVSPNSAEYVASIGLTAHLHPYFGTNPKYGIPYTVVGAEQPDVPIKLTKYRRESDPGPYPVPLAAPIEGGGKNGTATSTCSCCRKARGSTGSTRRI